MSGETTGRFEDKKAASTDIFSSDCEKLDRGYQNALRSITGGKILQSSAGKRVLSVKLEEIDIFYFCSFL